MGAYAGQAQEQEARGAGHVPQFHPAQSRAPVPARDDRVPEGRGPEFDSDGLDAHDVPAAEDPDHDERDEEEEGPQDGGRPVRDAPDPDRGGEEREDCYDGEGPDRTALVVQHQEECVHREIRYVPVDEGLFLFFSHRSL